jgi:hypothetical protein
VPSSRDAATPAFQRDTSAETMTAILRGRSGTVVDRSPGPGASIALFGGAWRRTPTNECRPLSDVAIAPTPSGSEVSAPSARTRRRRRRAIRRVVVLAVALLAAAPAGISRRSEEATVTPSADLLRSSS